MNRMRRPAWSVERGETGRARLVSDFPPRTVTGEWAWKGATGKGIRVAVIDSGVESGHPAIAGTVVDWCRFDGRSDGELIEDSAPHSDAYGHGTACAGIIRNFVADVDLVSVKVLGSNLGGSGAAFAAGLKWCVERKVDVINLSLGTTRKSYQSVFYELADRAYFEGVVLVTAANNMVTPTFPSLFASVISVACHDGGNPYEYRYNPTPPVEFTAPGINVRAPWLGGSYRTLTGNSFAAPHITGIVAKIKSKHPDLTPFEIKTILRATASNVHPKRG